MAKSNSVMMEVGRGLAHVSTYWRPVGNGVQCTECGGWYYHIIAHGLRHMRGEIVPVCDDDASEDVMQLSLPMGS